MALEYYNQVIKLILQYEAPLEGYVELAEYDKAIESTDALLKLGYRMRSV